MIFTKMKNVFAAPLSPADKERALLGYEAFHDRG